MRSILILLLLASATTNAATVIIDFEEVAPQNVYGLLSVSSKSYDLSTTGIICGGPGDQFSDVSSAGLYIENPAPEPFICGVGIAMDRSDAGAFAIHSFDLYGISAGVAQFYGTLAGGGSANLNVAVGTGDWLNLESFDIFAENFFNNGLGIDNINVSAVPVPAAVWLFGSALAGLGWIRRKQTV